jgi:hypothetical protein
VTTAAAPWVTARTGAELLGAPGAAVLALRRNPRRAHLLVSLLLGKHVPVPVATLLDAAAGLAAEVRAALDGAEPFVVGFAETATALGHAVAAAAGPGGTQASYAHTTRRPVPPDLQALAFLEEHSHAVDQGLAVRDEEPLRDPHRPLVLVDDELSSGRTAVNAVAALQSRWPRDHYVLASLLDVRSPEQHRTTQEAVARLGARLTSVCLLTGEVRLPADLAERAAALVAAEQPDAAPGPPVPVRRWVLHLPARTPLTGALGWDATAEAGLREATRRLADALRPETDESVLVLGDEELMYAGQLTAAALGPTALTSSTTRSPALVVDEPGYPLRTALRFGSTDDAGRPAFAYNVAASRHVDRGPAPGFDDVVLVADREPSPTLLAALAGAAGRSVHVVVLVEGDGPEPVVEGPS